MSVTGPIDELRSLTRSSSTGELICAGSALEIHVYLQAGRVAWASTSSRPLDFVRHIREECRVDDDALRHVLDACRRDRLPLGETLVAWGLVERSQVREALRRQIQHTLAELRATPPERMLFLERRGFERYDPDLTFELDEFPLPEDAPTRTISEAPSVADHLLATVDGAEWVEMFEGERRTAVAPRSHPGGVPPGLLASSLGDGSDFVAVRARARTLVGVAVPRRARTLWCSLASGSTFGAAVSTLTTLGVGHDPGVVARSSSPIVGHAWRLGEPSAIADQVRLLVERAWDVAAVVVLDPDGGPTGLSRLAPPPEELLPVLARREAALRACGDDDASIATGDGRLWLFGAALGRRHGRTIWVVLDRRVAQGVGWACLAALVRSLRDHV